MKKVLIILANYFPHPSSVANCMKPLISSLSKVYDVDILTNRKDANTPEFEENAAADIYRVDDYRAMATMHLNELNTVESSFFLKAVTKGLTIFLKIIYFLRYSFLAKERITGGWNIERVYEKYQEMEEKRAYDLVISVSLPFQSHYIAEKIKDHNGDEIRWIAFEFDPFAFNDVIKVSGRHRKKMFSDEKRILKKCDAIILTPELYSYYKEKRFVEFTDKVQELAFANLEPVIYDAAKVTDDFMKKGKINCLFTGLLYEDIRNPEKLLTLFSQVDESISLTLMTNWSQAKMKQYAPGNYEPSVIPFQNRDTAIYNLIQADVLINIGNTVELQVPGKIFEYMSTGKPIVHLSKMKKDPVLKYLQHYPKALILNEWEIGKKNYVEELERFCMENEGHVMDFHEVSASLGEYSGVRVVETFHYIVRRVLGENSL